jgi:hypothetical protein
MLRYRGHMLHISATQTAVNITASPCDSAPVTVRVAGHLTRLAEGQTVTVPIGATATPGTSPHASTA